MLRPVWCPISSRIGEIGVAALPEPDGRTRFFLFEKSALFGRLVKPIFAWNIRQDFRRLTSLL